ncbi:MAG: ubiquinol-cytochrome c reductase iron-sulfur subunit [Myxococcales bacterium]|jgi:menaquinol-cytochrome c reductase iron-sulfur subunit|nr:MAG: ubiquinol-cytochrome c reductase iron-sulfur subunit [Myxococcales bacterium]
MSKKKSDTAESTPVIATRRSFLFKLGIALNVVAASLIGVPIIGYILSSLRSRAWQAWIPLGPVDGFRVGQTRLSQYVNPFTAPWDGETANIPCWVRRLDDDEFKIFAINCTHLGCPVRWFQESGLFMCPCHGGVYYEDGTVASGPPPRPLYQYQYRVRAGQLEVQAGQTPTLAAPSV